MQSSQLNDLSKGMNRDTDYPSMPDNYYPYANDLEQISDEEFASNIKNSKAGTLQITKVPNATPQTIMFRVRTYSDLGQAIGGQYWTNQTFVLKDANGVQVGSSLVIANLLGNAVTNTDFKTYLDTEFAGNGTVALQGTSVLYTTITLTSPIYNSVVSCTQQVVINGVADVKINELVVIRELITTETELEPLAYVNSQNLGFILSVSADNTITELGVVDEDNNWTYTRLLRTKNFILSKTQPIKFIVEQQNDGVYALYFTDNTIKDKCIYVPPALTQDCCLTYNPTNIQVAGKGIYNLVKTDAQTNSQLVNNIGYVSYKNTLQSGGGLLTGGKRYVCRFGINGSNITTQWSMLSNIVPVIAASADSGLAWVSTEGTPSGTPTSKQNILTINNAQADVFNFVELAVVNYTAQNASSAEIVGRFDVLAESFDIIHSGLEQTTLLDVVSLIEAEPIILKVKDIETKKNRINRANIVTANEDAKWQAIAENAVVTTQRFSDSLSNTGILATGVGNVRFWGYSQYSTFLSIANGNKRVLSLVPNSILGVTPSPFVQSTGAYTVTSADEPVLQMNLTAYGTIQGSSDGLSNFNMYFVVYKAGVEVASILMADFKRNNDSIQTIYNVSVNTLINVNVALGDVLEFKYQFYSADGNAQFTLNQDGINLRINQVGSQSATQFKGTQVGEYQIPYNVANRTGYMLYEYYMTYVRFHLKNGYITAPYPLGKYYIDNATYKRGLVQILPTDPKTPFTDTSTLYNRKVYNYALSVANLDLFYVKDELLGVSFERSEPLNTVIGSGIYHNARVVDGDTYTSGKDYVGGVLSDTSSLRKFGLFLSNDLDNQVIKYSKGDYLKLLGLPRVLGYNDNYKSGNDKTGVITELLGSVFNGSVGAPEEDDMTLATYPIEDSSTIDFNSVGNTIYNTTADLYYKPSTSTLNNAYTNAKGVAVATTNYVATKFFTANDKNTFIAFYIRPINLSTIDYKNYKPIPTGEIVRITSSTPDVLPATTFYGGDTYTQKVIRKEASWYTNPINTATIPTPPQEVVSTIITFYAQNRLNSQLFYTDTTAPKATWNLQGSKSLYQYLFPFANSSELVDEQHNFDKSYIGANQVNRISPYNPLLPYPTSNPTRIYYSDEKAVGSLYDAYRKVKPLNFVDLELQNGAITAIFDIRDVMVVIQPNFVGAIPYAADTMIQSDNTAKILVGSGTVYSNRVYPLSSFGTELKTATLKGYNVNGNPQVYWLSKDFTNINRYDYSGVKILTDQNSMRTFIKNNVAHIKNEFDVNLYYDVNKSDVTVTARASKIFPNWISNYPYVVGDTVSFGGEGYYPEGDFEKINATYVCKNNVTSTVNPFLDSTLSTSNWTRKEFTDNAYYNHWSLIFNEVDNMFLTFLSALQKRYFTHNKRIFTPRGISEFGRIYEINVGEPLKFFEQNGTWKQGQFCLDILINKGGAFKRFITITLENGTYAIIDADVTTETDTNFSTCTEHEARANITYYPIQPDFNNELFGTYLLVKIRSYDLVKIRSISGIFNNINIRR